MKKFLLFILCLGLLCSVILVLLPKDTIKNAALKLAIKHIEASTNFRVEIESPRLNYPCIIQAKTVKIYSKASSPHAPYLSAEDIEACINPLALLSSKLNLHHFYCQRLSIQSLPEVPLTAQAETDFFPLPFAMKVGRFEIKQFNLSLNLMKKLGLETYVKADELEKGISLAGSFSSKSLFPSVKGELFIAPCNAPAATTAAAFTLKKNYSNYFLLITLSEVSKGILQKPSFFEHSTLSFRLDAHGDKQKWQGVVEVLSEQEQETVDQAFTAGYAKGNFVYLPDQLLTFEAIEGNTPFANFYGTLSLDSGLEFDHTFLHTTFTDLPFPHKNFKLGSETEMGLSVKGPLLSPSLQATLYSESMEIKEWTIAHPEISVSFSPFRANSEGELSFSGKRDNVPFQVKTKIALKPEQAIHFSDAIATYASSNLEGDLLVSFTQPSLKGQIKSSKISFKDFNSDWKGTAEIQASFDKESLLANVWVKNLAYQNLSAQNGHLQLQAKDLFHALHGEVQIALSKGLWEEIAIEDLTFVSGYNQNSLSASPFSLDLKGNYQKPFLIQSKGKWLYQKEIAITLESLWGEVLDLPISLKEPFEIVLEAEKMEISPLFLSTGSGYLYASAEYSPTFVQSTLRIHDFPLTAAHLLAPQFPLKGSASGQIFLFGDPETPRGQLNLEMSNVKIEEEAFNKFPPFNVSFQASLVEQLLECRGQIIEVEKNPLKGEAKIPLTFSLSPFMAQVNRELPFSASLSGKGPLSPLLSLLFIDKIAIDGDIEVQLGIRGLLNSPEIEGFVNLRNGFFESINSGAILRSIHAKIKASGQRLTLENFSAKDEIEGTITGSGSLAFNDPLFPFEAKFKLNKLQLLDMDFFQSTASGSLTLKGNRNEGVLSGTLTSNKTQMTLPTQISEVTEAVEVTYINIPEGESSPVSSQSKKSAWPLKLNILLKLPSKATFTAPSLSSEWQGDLLLEGTADEPSLDGQLKIVKGSYLFNGKQFIIKDGTVNFAGNLTNDTTLYVVGSMDLHRIVAEVIVRGAIKNPTLSLNSNPPLSQQEILSWILFGKGLSEISPFQGDQLTASLTDLSRQQEGPDLLTRIRNQTGIDRIDINRSGEGDSGDVSFEVGKYITSGTYVSVSKNMGSESNEVNIETSIIKNFKLQAGVSDDANGHFDIIWKYDY
ncbi:translocation/assembly module TamB domain-containing protein [Parachlamydia sp. AcF125]|uniref:translocation/assembly module TamB domain-containing protein n=1 Tax=Parachlamydia sp. AcF125 TaxID=2795736 RepID=UPI001BCA12B6|nr:translocation/assembly module TamB domain-containing protein [Parachlamydia sp. AcF125]MBS4169049.1 Translocation and assembly module subunit TamB [Parachlamydia sp. AcF125]